MGILYRCFTLKSVCYTAFILFFVSFALTNFFYMFVVSQNFMHPFHGFMPDDVRCYLETTRYDHLDEEYLKQVHSEDVFIHYTPCHFYMKPVHLCAIEAAAIAYPSRKVNVPFTKPLTFYKTQQKIISDLMLLSNVEFVRIHIDQYLDTTPFKSILGKFETSALNRGVRKYKNIEDLLKLATLYNYGGKIIDSNVIIAEPIYDLAKWAIMENDVSISSAILAFDKPQDDIVKMSIE